MNPHPESGGRINHLDRPPLLQVSFAHWQNDWIICGGKYSILVGSWSRDIRLQGSVSLGKKTL